MKSLTDFMCICSDKSRSEADACMERVLADLKTTPEDIVTAVVFGLEWGLPDGFHGSIEGIGCDQWCGVSAEVQKLDETTRKYEKHTGIWVQCDRVEHGIARVWELAKEAANAP